MKKCHAFAKPHIRVPESPSVYSRFRTHTLIFQESCGLKKTIRQHSPGLWWPGLEAFVLLKQSLLPSSDDLYGWVSTVKQWRKGLFNIWLNICKNIIPIMQTVCLPWVLVGESLHGIPLVLHGARRGLVFHDSSIPSVFISSTTTA